jgi:hypothetical protein
VWVGEEQNELSKLSLKYSKTSSFLFLYINKILICYIRTGSVWVPVVQFYWTEPDRKESRRPANLIRKPVYPPKTDPVRFFTPVLNGLGWAFGFCPPLILVSKWKKYALFYWDMNNKLGLSKSCYIRIH